MYLALRKCEDDCKILKIILVTDFCPLKPEIARFCIGFRLNSFFTSLFKEETTEKKKNDRVCLILAPALFIIERIDRMS